MKFLYLLIFLFISFSSFSINEEEIQARVEASDALYAQDPHASYSILIELEKELLQEGINDIPGEISLYKGRYNVLITDYEAASKELNEAIRIFKKQKNGKRLATSYRLKSILSRRIGEADEGLRLLKMAFEIAKEEKDNTAIISALSNLSLQAVRRPDSLQAKLYLLELESYKGVFRDLDFYYFYQNKGSYFKLIENYSAAISAYNKAKDLAFEMNMIDSKATILFLMSKCYVAMGNMDIAEKLAKESYVFSGDNELNYEEAEALRLYIEIKSLNGEFKEAFDLQEKLIRLEKTILNSEKIRNIKNEEYKREIKLKEIAISESKLQLELESVSKKRYRNFFFLFLIISVLLTALVVGIWYFYKKIKELNFKINSQTEQLTSTNQDLVKLNGLHEKIFSVISHDFKGPLLSMRLLIEVLKKQENETMSFYTSDIKNQLIQSELILQNLLDWAKSELKLEKSKTDETTNVFAVIEEVKAQLKVQTDAKSLSISNKIDETIKVEIPADILKIVFRNLLSNAIKYSQEGGEIECGMDAKSEFFVKDYGKGISEEKRKNIFKDLVVSSLGTSLETGFGLGLYLTKEILSEVGGDIRISEQEEVGSRFCFRV